MANILLPTNPANTAEKLLPSSSTLIKYQVEGLICLLLEP